MSAGDPLPPQTPDLTKVDDEDLARVLRHLNRHTKAGRLKAAKDPVTRAYLQAGLRLLNKQFDTISVDGEQEDDPQPSPFFAWLSRAKIIEEMKNEQSSQLPRIGTLNGIRDRWEPHRHYIADLLLVALASDHWTISLATNDQLVQSLMGEDLPSAAHEMAFQDLEALTATAVSFQVQMIAASFAERDPVVRQSLKQVYELVTHNWSHVYAMVLESLGAQLRPGLTLVDFTNMLTAAAEGFALRLLADPDAKIINRNARTSLLGTLAIGLLMSCIDLGDGLSVEDAARSGLNVFAARRREQAVLDFS